MVWKMRAPVSRVEFATLLLSLHVGLEEQIESIPLIGKEMSCAMTEVFVGCQIQIWGLAAERFFRSFDHTCCKVLAL